MRLSFQIHESHKQENHSPDGPGERQETLFEKQLKAKRTGVVAEVVDCLPRKYEVLNSNPSITKKKKMQKQNPLIAMN
jgi:hypothetical protein